jgi:hypothetical protein
MCPHPVAPRHSWRFLAGSVCVQEGRSARECGREEPPTAGVAGTHFPLGASRPRTMDEPFLPARRYLRVPLHWTTGSAIYAPRVLADFQRQSGAFGTSIPSSWSETRCPLVTESLGGRSGTIRRFGHGAPVQQQELAIVLLPDVS